MTEKLYLNDSLVLEFQACFLTLDKYRGRPSLLLDRTAFYPEAGGQLADEGHLIAADDRITIEDAQIDEQGRIHHLFTGVPPTWPSGTSLQGQVAFERRRDMMSQHSGQHLLSAVCKQTLDAATVSSRLGSSDCTLDLDREDLSETELATLAETVNDLILENRPMRIHYPDDQELTAMNLRRTPKVDRAIRVIEIEGYDLTPCGGTHCTATGQIGAFHILGKERTKGNVRLHFICGKRVLQYLRTQEQTLSDLGNQLGCGAPGVPEAITKITKQLTDCRQQLGQTRSIATHLLAQQYHQQNPATGTPTPILVIREQDDQDLRRALAAALAQRPDVVAAVASRDPKSGDWQLSIECGETADFHAGNWFRKTAPTHGGRGGGRPQRAEGRFPGTLDLTTLDWCV
jgi:alanyl-tRNA synthetase